MQKSESECYKCMSFCIPPIMKEGLTHGFGTEYKFRVSSAEQVLWDSNCMQVMESE